MKASTVAYGAMLAASSVEAQNASPKPSQAPVPGAFTSAGCWTGSGNMTVLSPPIQASLVSSGSCMDGCKKANFYVAATHGQECYCGFLYPALSDKASDDKCNYPCPAYPLEACGASDAWSVYNLGVQIFVKNYEPSASSTSTPASSGGNKPSPTSSNGGAATSVSQTSAASESSQPQKGGPNVAGIAAGVVVGVVAAAAAIAGFFFYFRRKRNAEIEEEHRRNAAVNAFISGSKPPSSHGSISMTDSRLDPVMAHRRMSDGSIADNEDYSRRILRV